MTNSIHSLLAGDVVVVDILNLKISIIGRDILRLFMVETEWGKAHVALPLAKFLDIDFSQKSSSNPIYVHNSNTDASKRMS